MGGGGDIGTVHSINKMVIITRFLEVRNSNLTRSKLPSFEKNGQKKDYQRWTTGTHEPCHYSTVYTNQVLLTLSNEKMLELAMMCDVRNHKRNN